MLALLNRVRNNIHMRRKFGVSLVDMDDIRDELEVAALHAGGRELLAQAETIKMQTSVPPCFSLIRRAADRQGARSLHAQGPGLHPKKTVAYEGRLASAAEDEMRGRTPFAARCG